MAESKIILSLSSMREGAGTYQYVCADHPAISGTQTNEAPVKYLLDKDPSISQILCLVTPTAAKTALAHFRAQIAAHAPRVKLELIDAPDNGHLPQQTLAEVLRRLNPGDTVYMDSSGGTRYGVMGLLQLARILEYKGVRLHRVVYANLSFGQQPSIDDVTDLYRKMDLISGMHELAEFGSVDTLERYFRKDTSPDAAAIVHLLDAIVQMTDAITLCRLGALKTAMAGYQEALDRAEAIQDPLMRELMDIFRKKFGDQVTTPWLVNWCLDHRLLVQALSIYREWMPEYILRGSGLFTQVPALTHRWRLNSYQDEHVFQWTWLMNLGLPSGKRPQPGYTIDSLRHLETYLPGSGFAVTDLEKVRRVAWDFQYIQKMRNMVVHSNDSSQKGTLMMDTLAQEHYDVDFEAMSVSDMIGQIRRALQRIENP